MGLQTISTVLLTTVLLGSVTAFAFPPDGEEALPFLPAPTLQQPCGPPPPPHCRCDQQLLPPHHGETDSVDADHQAPELRQKIRQLLLDDHVRLEPVIQKLQENRQALITLADQKPFDETRITALATEQGRLQAELLVSRIRIQHRIRELMESVKPAEK